MASLPMSRKLEMIGQMTNGLQARFDLNDNEPILNNVPTGGMDNAAPSQCKCELMTRIPANEGRMENYQCNKI